MVIIAVRLQFQLFGQAQLLTQGGPSGASRPIVLFIYEAGFRRWDIGYAAAAAEILFRPRSWSPPIPAVRDDARKDAAR